ncbi:MAG: extracellular solute-binding protein [Clostridiales bacterium]|jgi:maltose-binding protein MalE|nr:extracellular solute-binding protein [Clostridiales bacterium]
MLRIKLSGFKKIPILLFAVIFLCSCKESQPEIKKTAINTVKEFTIFVEGPEDRALFINLADRFKNSEYSLKVLDTNDLLTANADLAFYNPNNYDMENLISENIVKPLDPERITQLDDFTKSKININGNFYYAPVTADAFGIIVNTSMLGDKMPMLEYPISWGSLINISESLNGYGLNMYAMPEIKRNNFFMGLAASVATQGLSGQDISIDQTILNQLTSYLKSIYDASSSSFKNYGYDQALNEFASGKTAMVFGTTEDLMNVLFISPDISLEFIPLPQISDGFSSIALDYNRVISITGDENAHVFIDYFFQNENLNYYINSNTYFSVISTAVSDMPELNKFNQNIFSYGYTLNLNNKLPSEAAAKLIEGFSSVLAN